MAIIQVYWDANCFLGIFNDESDKVTKCRGTIAEAEKGDLYINTSAITLTEVIKLKGKPLLHAEKEQMIIDFFKHEYIIIHNVDRKIAEHARHLIWKYNFVMPKDAIHLATAVLRKISTFHTFDDDLLKLDNKLGNPKIHVCKPDIPHQGQLPYSQ